ncbi:sigma-54 dependent transcriptional regulator [bacterium]|nr:sigma-54 dependent transcriptional regulator [bacterium]
MTIVEVIKLLNKLCLNIVAARPQQRILKELLPPFEHVEHNFYVSSQLQEVVSEFQEDAVNIIWIDQTMIRSLHLYVGKDAFESMKKNTVLAGGSLSASDAIQLGRIGFNRFFQLPNQSESFIEILLQFYEARKNSQSKQSKATNMESNLVGSSPPVQILRNLIKKVAPRDKLMILIRGETGTGKGLIARMLHDFSPRADKAFVEINCTAIPDGLVEAELFGHEKGAFTDAHRSRRGIFEMAHGGTLFLDEIGYLRPEIQVKLLKVLEDRRFRRVGGEKDIQVDCRIITGTSVDLETKIENNEFRQDLYYRLNVFPIVVPPLRERGEDILRLAEHFRAYYGREHCLSNKGFDIQARDFMLKKQWNGNVRELKHSIERAVILSEDRKISIEALEGMYMGNDLDDNQHQVVSNADTDELSGVPRNIIKIELPDHGKSMDEIQREIIEQVLVITESNRSEAARLLKISRSRLLRRIGTSDNE